jgi:hypothetical protein
MYRDQELGLVFHQGVLARSEVPLRVAQLVRVPFSVVYTMLATRFVLEYVQAGSSGFTQWIARLTDAIYVPMSTLFENGHDPAGHPIPWSLLIAIGGFAVIHGVLVSWLREVAPPYP